MKIFTDAAAWREWLSAHHTSDTEVWVVLAKKGTTEPTSLTHEQAVQEALCHGWIDGLTRRRDEATYTQRYTPRRPRSSWSRPNIARVARLRKEGRMRPAGLAEVERAQADGRWHEPDVPAEPSCGPDEVGSRA
ncbi:YdeI family protein [Nonomuraea sp. NPDC050540]|uniref:YdeI family protein n=1 Tax=Nonomuraea sp. NPDC050540 TaxID=3364367 RepID=UPI00379141AC